MPQSTQHSLLYILLLWTTIISIIQVVFTILFFTTGHTGTLSQNSSAVEPAPHISQPLHHNTPSPSTKNLLRLGPGKMITFTATKGEGRIEWVKKNTRADVIKEEREVLTIDKDGYYFLNLQVSSCENSKNLEYTVRLTNKNNNKVLLEGWINTKTNTTGVLSKVEELSAPVKLEVSIDPPIECLNENESATHLDIIFMQKTL